MAKEILIYGSIVHDEHRSAYRAFYGEDHEMMTPRMLKEELDDANGGDILLRVNSSGGHSDAGFAMQSILSQYHGKVTALIDGLAASAATMLLMSPNVYTKIAKNAGLMVHLNSMVLFDRVNSKSLAEIQKALANYDQRLAQSYADKTGMSAEEWLAEMESDLYLLADEALEFGLVDEITTGSDVAIAYSPKDIRSKAKMPKCLRERLETFQAIREKNEKLRIKSELDRDLRWLEVESLTY